MLLIFLYLKHCSNWHWIYRLCCFFILLACAYSKHNCHRFVSTVSNLVNRKKYINKLALSQLLINEYTKHAICMQRIEFSNSFVGRGFSSFFHSQTVLVHCAQTVYAFSFTFWNGNGFFRIHRIKRRWHFKIVFLLIFHSNQFSRNEFTNSPCATLNFIVLNLKICTLN